MKAVSLGHPLPWFWGPQWGLPRGPPSVLIPLERSTRSRGSDGTALTRVPVCSQSSPEEQLLSLYVIYTVGYALSFSALVIASAILLSFR